MRINRDFFYPRSILINYKNSSFFALGLTIILLFALTVTVSATGTSFPSMNLTGDLLNTPVPHHVAPSPETLQNHAVMQVMALPLAFIPNNGQYDPAVSYVATGPTS